MFYPVIPLAESKAVGANVAFAMVLAPNRSYLVTATGACWIKQGNGAQVAAAGAAGNFFVAANAEPIVVRGDHGTNLSVIQDGAATGFATITPAQE